VKSDNNECQLWLQKANKQLDNLKIEKEAVILESENRGRVHRLNGLMSVDLIDEYRTWGLDQLQDARKEYEREVADMTREFGELHIIPLGLYRTIGNLLDALGEFANSKTLRMQLREKIESTYGIGHPYYIQSLLDVAESHTILGEWMEAQILQEEVLKLTANTRGSADTALIINLASTYRNQGRWKKAEELQVQVMQTLKEVFGQEHPETLACMGNLARTYNIQGRWQEAEALEVQAMETRERVLGHDYPSTLISMCCLASTYRYQGRLKEAEMLEVEALKAIKRVLGQEHPDTLISMNNLAITYRSQGRLREAEELQVSEISRPVRPGSLRTGTDGLPPSVLGPDGDGAVFLNVDGDGEVTVPGSHPPSPADNGRLQNIFR